MESPVSVTREIEAVQIPDGYKVLIPIGTSVRIMQALGGTYTVVTDWGAMVRISSQDADAIGKVAASPVAVTQGGVRDIKEEVWEHLRMIYDPEIPVNIVELGLVYKCELSDLPSGKKHALVEFTLTAPGCGMGDVLKSDIEERLHTVPGVESVDVHVVFEPQWDQTMMSEAARLQLGLL